METSPLWSLDWVRAVQGLGDWALTPMQVFTLLGQEFLAVLIPFLFWCVSKPAGVDLSILMVGSSFVNFSLKAFFKAPRPFWLDQALQRATASSFSFPSGHAQSAATVFGGLAYLAVRSKRARLTRILAVIMLALLVLLVSVSRIYLGVHFPGDTLIGILAGLLVLTAYVYIKPRGAPILARLSLSTHALLALAAALLVFGIHSLGLLVQIATRPAAADLITAAGEAAAREAGSLAGLTAGLWLGLVVESRYVRFQVGGRWWKRLLRYVLGGATCALIYAGLHTIADAAPAGVSVALLALCYALVALWAFALWPWIFVRLGWAERDA